MSAVQAQSLTAPQVLYVQPVERGNEVELTLHVPAQLCWFEGHFPGVPLLPGVVQTAWVVEFAHRYFRLQPHFRYMNNLKFMRLIRPDATVMLWLRHDEDRCEVAFEYRDAGRVCASGRRGFGE